MRKKKEQEYVYEIIEEPSHSFCKSCKGKDLRMLQDTLNLCYITLSQVTDYLGFGGSINKRCKDLTNWVRTNQMKDEGVKKKVKRRKGNVNG